MKLTKYIDLLENEKLILEGRANRWASFGSIGGRLYLTNQRLLFVKNFSSISTEPLEIPLSTIVMQGNVLKFKISTNILSFNMTINTDAGKTHKFVVTRKQKNLWIQHISVALTEYITSNNAIKSKSTTVGNVTSNFEDKFAPKDGVEVTNNVTQKSKVVDCAGCGYFVVVTLGTEKCEYCKRQAF